MNKNTSFPFPIPSLPVNKVGIVLGSMILGEWVVNDLIHIPAGGVALITATAGAWFLSRSSKGSFKAPMTVKGWISRCNEVLAQFQTLEGEEEYSINSQKRENDLEQITQRSNPQSLALVSTLSNGLPEINTFKEAIAGPIPVKLSWLPSSLPIQNDFWKYPTNLFEKDSILYYLPLPLRAVDLIWLEKVPLDQPSWILVTWEDSSSWNEHHKALLSQLPDRWNNRVLQWNGQNEQIKDVLTPVRRYLEQPGKNLDLTRQRLLSRLHSSWQSDLELLRREKFRVIQNRSQWLVAGAVFASPVPTTDLLSVAVVNGLMIQEMGKLWACNIDPNLLKAVARQLALAALAQGVVEWSGQALLGVAKLHGGTWIAAGSMQALSAAYLTRVVGRSMADWMALNNGVSQPDLELLHHQAPELVSKAAASEKVDWNSFIQQANEWLKDTINDPKQQLGLG